MFHRIFVLLAVVAHLEDAVLVATIANAELLDNLAARLGLKSLSYLKSKLGKGSIADVSAIPGWLGF